MLRSPLQCRASYFSDRRSDRTSILTSMGKRLDPNGDDANGREHAIDGMRLVEAEARCLKAPS